MSDFDTIFDPMSMFSGRMLATVFLGKKYIGVTPSFQTQAEANEIITFLKKYFTIDAQVLRVGDTNLSNEYPCLFTRPLHGYDEFYPYTMSEFRSCDDWIDIYTESFKCKRYVFVVDKTEKYKEYIKEEITTKSHLYTSNEKIIIIDK